MKKSQRVIRSAYSHREPVNNPVSGEPTRTKQEFKNDVNINTIIERMRKGINPPQWMTSATPRYGDFTNLPVSFQEAHAIMAAGQEAFASLPLEFRRALDHDPRNLDHAPRELYEQFGLLKKPAASEQASPASNVSGNPEGQGDRDLPAKAPSGANKTFPKRTRGDFKNDHDNTDD